MSGKKKYFPNNVRRIQSAPAEMFEQHEFEEVMEWRVCSWELPDRLPVLLDVKTLRLERSRSLCINNLQVQLRS